MKKIIITGATSFIGSALTRLAVQRGIGVTAIVRRGSANMRNLNTVINSPLLNIAQRDIDEYDNLDIRGCDTFFHLAWAKTDVVGRDNVYAQTDNIRHTADAVRLAARAGCTAFVGVGSQAEYGRVDFGVKLRGDTPVNPESGYGIAKYAAGKMAKLLCKHTGMRFNWVRILSTYGEYDSPNTLIAYLIRTLLAGEKPALTQCEQMWDYMYVRDTAAALLAVGERGADGKTYALGTGRVMPLRQYAEIVRDTIAPALPLGFGEKEYYPHQPMYLCADIRELTADTGFVPEYEFEAGINSTLQNIGE